MATHTKGPWVFRGETIVVEGMGAFAVNSPPNLRAEGEIIVAGVVDIDQQVWPECGNAEANAQLIAAAPVMYEALKRIVKVRDDIAETGEPQSDGPCDGECFDDWAADLAERAIAKAEGK